MKPSVVQTELLKLMGDGKPRSSREIADLIYGPTSNPRLAEARRGNVTKQISRYRQQGVPIFYDVRTKAYRLGAADIWDRMPVEVKMQAQHDMMLYGTGFFQLHADGTYERLPPESVEIHNNRKMTR